MEENKFILRKYIDGSYSGTAEEISVADEIVNNVQHGGHSGGDFAIMHDLVAYLNGDRSSLSITKLDDSINGHLCIFAAEESRKSGQKVAVDSLRK